MSLNRIRYSLHCIMHIHWSVLLFFCGSCALSLDDSFAQTLSMSVKDAVERARSNNPRHLEAQIRVQEASANIGIARAAFFPDIRASGSALYQKDRLNGGSRTFGGEPYNTYDFRFTLIQPIYRGGGVWAGLDAARAQEQINQLDLEIANRELTLETIRVYFSVILNQKRLDVLKGTQRLLEELHELSKGRLRIGRSTRVETLQVQTELALTAPRIVEAENQVALSAAELATLLGDRENTSYELNASLDPGPWKSLDAQITKLATDTKDLPDLRKLGVLVEQFEDLRTVQMAEHWPSFNGVATWARTSNKKMDLFDGDSTGWNLGVELSIPIFTGLSSISERRSLASQAGQLDARNLQAVDSVRLEQIRSAKNLEVTREIARGSVQAFDLAGQALNEAKRNYRLGTVDYQQLLISQQSLLNSETAMYQSKFDYIVAVTRAAAARGFAMDKLLDFVEAR